MNALTMKMIPHVRNSHLSKFKLGFLVARNNQKII